MQTSIKKAQITNQDTPKKMSKSRKKPNKTIVERFSDYQGNYQCTEYDWGTPAGKEIW